MAKKRRSNPRQKHPLTRLAAPPFAARPGGPRRVSTRPPKAGPPPMADWFRRRYPLAPLTEWWVWWWLTSVGHKQPNIDFVYQDPVLGGRTAGGQVLDFVMIDRFPKLAIFVDGDYYHFGNSFVKYQGSLKAAQNVRDYLGYDTVIVWESQLLTELDGVMRRALDGIETPLPLNLPH